MTFIELLQFSNILILPALVYIIKLERRLLTLEIRLTVALEKCANCASGRRHLDRHKNLHKSSDSE